MKKREQISWGEPILWMAELFGPPFCISILLIWRTQAVHNSLEVNSFFTIQLYFSQCFKNSEN